MASSAIPKDGDVGVCALGGGLSRDVQWWNWNSSSDSPSPSVGLEPSPWDVGSDAPPTAPRAAGKLLVLLPLFGGGMGIAAPAPAPLCICLLARDLGLKAGAEISSINSSESRAGEGWSSTIDSLVFTAVGGVRRAGRRGGWEESLVGVEEGRGGVVDAIMDSSTGGRAP